MNSKSTSNKSKTDWQRLSDMSDSDIDLSDCSEVTPEMFAGAIVRKPIGSRVNITLTIDRDVLEWFNAQGDKADLQMALALKIYADANKAFSIGN
jgi:uncharacterized protein (DUF4415 family)